MIEGGYYLIARQLWNSKVALKPPHYRETWNWLIKEANHAPCQHFGLFINRGQLLRSIDDIIEGLKWFEGFRKHIYPKRTISKAISFFRDEKMIETQKLTRGLLITVINYDFFQDVTNYINWSNIQNETYGGTNGGRTEGTSESNIKGNSEELSRSMMACNTQLDYQPIVSDCFNLSSQLKNKSKKTMGCNTESCMEGSTEGSTEGNTSATAAGQTGPTINNELKELNNNNKNKYTLDEWKIHVEKSFVSILSDMVWIEKQKIKFPDVDILETIKDSQEYWAGHEGWIKKKKSPDSNWKATVLNAFKMSWVAVKKNNFPLDLSMDRYNQEKKKALEISLSHIDVDDLRAKHKDQFLEKDPGFREAFKSDWEKRIENDFVVKLKTHVEHMTNFPSFKDWVLKKQSKNGILVDNGGPV